MAPRLLLSIFGGILIYLSLSLYHGRVVNKLPERSGGGTAAAQSSLEQEKNWIQVTTETDGFAAGGLTRENDGSAAEQHRDDGLASAAFQTDHNVRVGIQGPPLPPVTEDPAALRSSLERERMKAESLAREKENLLFWVDALQAELEAARNQLRERDTELHATQTAVAERPVIRPAPSSPDEADSQSAPPDGAAASLQALSSRTGDLTSACGKIDSLSRRLRDASAHLSDAESRIRELHAELAALNINRSQDRGFAPGAGREPDLSGQEVEKWLAEAGRLESLLQEAKCQMAAAEGDITRSRLRAEAMLSYGRARDPQLTPFSREIDLLHARIAQMNSNLDRSESLVADLRTTEQQLRLQLTARGSDPEGVAAAAEMVNSLQPTAAGGQPD